MILWLRISYVRVVPATPAAVGTVISGDWGGGVKPNTRTQGNFFVASGGFKHHSEKLVQMITVLCKQKNSTPCR